MKVSRLSRRNRPEIAYSAELEPTTVRGVPTTIERAVGKRLPRVILPDFNYSARAEARLEIPLAERIAAIRAKKAEDRARAKAKADRKARGGRPG